MTARTLMPKAFGVVLPSLLLWLVGCTPARLEIREPPRLHSFSAPPSVPEPVVVPRPEPSVAVSVAGTSAMPDFGRAFLGLARLAASTAHDPSSRRADGASVASEGMLWNETEAYLTFNLLERGVTRFVDLSAGSRVGMDMEAQKSGTRTVVTRWSAPLDQMFFLGRVSRADHILHGRFVDAAVRPSSRAIHFQIDPEALEEYREKHAHWSEATGTLARQWRLELERYARDFDAAERAYLDDGGKMIEEPPNEAFQRRAAFRAFVDSARSELARWERRLESAPGPDDVRDAASRRRESENVTEAEVDLWVKLLDVESGEVTWGARLRNVARTDDGTLAPALHPVLDELLNLLLENTSGHSEHAPGRREDS